MVLYFYTFGLARRNLGNHKLFPFLRLLYLVQYPRTPTASFFTWLPKSGASPGKNWHIGLSPAAEYTGSRALTLLSSAPSSPQNVWNKFSNRTPDAAAISSSFKRLTSRCWRRCRSRRAHAFQPNFNVVSITTFLTLIHKATYSKF